jgi:hypothetical protein
MENIYIDSTATFKNRTRNVSQIMDEFALLHIPAENPRYPTDGTYRPHPIAADVLTRTTGAEFEYFNSQYDYDKIDVLNNLILDSEITDIAHILRIIANHDIAYIHHLIGRGFHETLNQI